MSDIDYCIQANPDISGIGVRAAIYAQNFLSFVPAIYALLDKEVTLTELDALEDQSITILITAFAILISTVIQALKVGGVSNVHTTIVLNLSWMNNTNTFIYFLLYVHYKLGLRIEGREDKLPSTEDGVEMDELQDGQRQKPPGALRHYLQLKDIATNPVLLVGSAHLTLMAAVGIWLWSDPGSFSNSKPCSLDASFVILGRSFFLSSNVLRGWSILLYSLFLAPILNLVIPMGLFYIFYQLYNQGCRILSRPKNTQLSIVPITMGLVFLFVTNIIFLVDTETVISKNKNLQSDTEAEWTFGQTLALLLLLAPLRDIFNAFRERAKNRINENHFRVALKNKNWDDIEWLIEQHGIKYKVTATG